MALLSDLPPELVLLIASLLNRKTFLDPKYCLTGFRLREPQLVPDLPSISALSRTCTVLYHTLDQHLYDLCASVEPLGKLALLFAVEHQLESAVDKLFLAGISLDTEFVFENDRCNLLQIAAALGLRAMVVKLLAMYGEENMMAKVLARCKTTPLIYAVRNGHMETVKLLAPIPRSCVAPPQGSGMQQQYLGDALTASARAGKLEIARCLIMEGADINFVGDHSYACPLFHAAGAGDLGVVQLLLASGADPNLQSRDGSRPLFNAANLDVAQALITAGADIHATDHRSRNVLAYFAEKNLVEMSRFFLERGVDPNHEDEIRETPLHYACSMNNAALVELFLQFGAATVEKASAFGVTPVHMAMNEYYWEIVKILEPLVQNPGLREEIDARNTGFFKSERRRSKNPVHMGSLLCICRWMKITGRW